MKNRLFFPLVAAMLLCTVFGVGRAQGNNFSAIELANLREDVRMLNQRMGELSLRLEQLERENNNLRSQAQLGAQSYATVAQLNDSLAELNRAMKTEIAASKDETLKHVAVQIKKLGDSTNTALREMDKRASRAESAVVSAAPVFSDDFPKEGTVYEVQKGDTIDSIARKTGGKKRDIINANRLVDPEKIQVGQKLAIPGGK
jgi:LysM repeat protein